MRCICAADRLKKGIHRTVRDFPASGATRSAGRRPEDDWLVLDNGTNLPDAELEICGSAPCAFAAKPERDDFDSAVLDVEYQSLRVPMTEYHMSLTERPGWLRLYGRAVVKISPVADRQTVDGVCVYGGHMHGV